MKLFFLLSLQMTKKLNYVKMGIRINIVGKWEEEVDETQKKNKLDVEHMYVDTDCYGQWNRCWCG